MMSLWDALRMNMMISYQELVRTFPNTFGLISTQSEEEIRELVSGLTQSATGKDPEITITTWEEWNSNRK
ncbi:type V toxin-antitoxin system endoribonuclease antitoxin GhoS, partial [Escherichia coli]|nr:type V toxin-antitoxin system endoribonuclease antitoxin GhoS [Escherichia coli]